MASGDTLLIFSALGASSPASNMATLDTRNNQPVLEFDAATQESTFFIGVMPRHYSGNGLTLTIAWMADTATTGNCIWLAAFERHDTATDRDADSFAGSQTVTTAAPGTSGFTAYSAIAFTNAQIDGLLAGEAFRLRIQRDAANVSDTMAGDAQLAMVEIRET